MSHKPPLPLRLSSTSPLLRNYLVQNASSAEVESLGLFVPQRFMCWKLNPSAVVLKGGRIFKRWTLVGGDRVMAIFVKELMLFLGSLVSLREVNDLLRPWVCYKVSLAFFFWVALWPPFLSCYLSRTHVLTT
jgi:hypothetical protein